MQEAQWAAGRPPISPSSYRSGAVWHRSIPGYRRDVAVLTLLTIAISVAAFVWFYRHGQILIWGDAVAHINIARRVFDSRDPGILRLGTVWLPLPHLVMIPFVVSNWMWRTGLGGSIPTMVAFVASAAGIFRLVRTSLGANREARIAAWVAASVFALNPNVLYMQSIAMGEVLAIGFLVWAMVKLADFLHITWRGEDMDAHAAARSLTSCALLLAAAMMTRYDGWFAAGAFSLVVFAAFWRRVRQTAGEDRRILNHALVRYVLLLAAVGAFWFAYNYALHGNPLEFVNGPYSAKAIEQRSSPGFVHPGDHDLTIAAIYYVKSVELTIADGGWQRPFWIVALAGIPLLLVFARRSWALLLLWFPLPFYALSVAYASIPIYMPQWYPFSYYNDRYGVALVPAIAVFTAAAGYAVAVWLGRRQAIGWIALGILVAGSYVAVLRNQPICLREAIANSRSRIAMEARLGEALHGLPPDSTLLMFLGAHVGALQQQGIPLRRTINESTERAWGEALPNPAAHADYVVACDGDPVAAAVNAHPEGLQLIQTVQVEGQPAARIYRSETSRSR